MLGFFCLFLVKTYGANYVIQIVIGNALVITVYYLCLLDFFFLHAVEIWQHLQACSGFKLQVCCCFIRHLSNTTSNISNIHHQFLCIILLFIFHWFCFVPLHHPIINPMLQDQRSPIYALITSNLSIFKTFF